jgi:hypothetical protein
MRFRTSRLSFHKRSILIFTFAFAALSISFTFGAFAKNQANNIPNLQKADEIWQDVDSNNIPKMSKREVVPTSYRMIRLNRAALEEVLRQAPMESVGQSSVKGVQLTLPLPDGTLGRFRIEESPIMAPELAARFPEIKTYRGQGIDDPTTTVRFDVTPTGFHAQLISATETVYVDPYANDTSSNYISYRKQDVGKSRSFSCLFDEGDSVGGKDISDIRLRVPQIVPSNGQTLRTYRLALAATAEYTIAAGGTVPLAMARMTTSLNRVNGIYERELAVRMTLVANNNLLIYTDPNTDPYTNNDTTGMMAQNQTNLDTVIGSANYDMGHVFSTGAGGTARIRSTCNATFKGQGVTGLPNPVGDPFDVDFVTHEMGHQHGGLHTFNTNAGSCSGFRNMISAFEPASGSTPMSYVGTCSPANLQPNANDYFHVRSLEEIVAHMTVAGNCAAQSATGNLPPTVNAGSNFNIPKNTPFALTATGSDPNSDGITFGWEEYDLGPSSPPEGDADGMARPIFRSYQPTTSPTRVFPSLQYILNNANVPPATFDCGLPSPCVTGESLPTITRTMNFQVTARDNRASGGGIISATMQVNVDGAAGPFVVTQPNTAVSWTGSSLQNVLWEVANTTSAPVSAANVNILLSTDGGNTFPTVLLAGTPNDGSQAITVPNISTTLARIKVEAAGNIFFDISNSNFTISPGISPTVQFSAAGFPVTEGTAGLSATVNRTGDTSGVSTVDFATSDGSGANNCNVVNGSASSRCDYLTSLGRLTFLAGETSKNITIPIVNDSYAEGIETFTITLSNPSGASLGSQASATITITDNEATNGVNPIDVSSFFVRQHYLDFLNREPDTAGLNFWVNEIEGCTPKPQCTEVKRVHVSAAFFLSIEFQESGYLVERTYKTAYGDASGTSTFGGTHPIAVPIVRLNEFLLDTQAIGLGVVVNEPGWEQKLENNKQALFADFVQRSRFITEFPTSMTAVQFVDKLNLNAGNPLSTAERNQLVTDLSTAAKTRAQVLRAVAEDPDLNTAEFRRAFVLMQYFGYLRRNPNDPQDSDYTGFDFWFTKLNQFNGNFVDAEMVKAFILSGEYRQRFGP